MKLVINAIVPLNISKGSWTFKPSPSYPRIQAPSDKHKVYKVGINKSGLFVIGIDKHNYIGLHTEFCEILHFAFTSESHM